MSRVTYDWTLAGTIFVRSRKRSGLVFLIGVSYLCIGKGGKSPLLQSVLCKIV